MIVLGGNTNISICILKFCVYVFEKGWSLTLGIAKVRLFQQGKFFGIDPMNLVSTFLQNRGDKANHPWSQYWTWWT